MKTSKSSLKNEFERDKELLENKVEHIKNQLRKLREEQREEKEALQQKVTTFNTTNFVGYQTIKI